jgi:hypothetical protein
MIWMFTWHGKHLATLQNSSQISDKHLEGSEPLLVS